MSVNLNASNDDAKKVISFIKDANPDLLLLVEATNKWAKELEGIGYQYSFGKPQDNCFGIMLLSRYPLSNTNVSYTGTAGVPTLSADVATPYGMFSIMGTHTLPPFSAEYSMFRNMQLFELPALTEKCKFPVILAGDLNISPWSGYFKKLLKRSGLKNSMKGFDVQSSWPKDLPFFRIPIDHVLYEQRIVIQNQKVGPNIGSDHFPVIVDFLIKPNSKL